MIITVLGTGTSQGIPIIGCDCEVCSSSDPKDKRSRVSVYIEDKGKKILIDIGPDFRRQMLDNGLSEVDAILLTHEHNDHVAGLDDIRPINFKNRSDMPVYGLQRVLQNIKARFAYIFESKKYPGTPNIDLKEITQEEFSIDSLAVVPIPVLHGRLNILGFRIGDFAYLTDVKTLPKEAYSKLGNLEVLIISALRREDHFSHLTLSEALEIISELKPKRTFLTHMSHQMGKHDDLESSLPDTVFVAYDGLQIEIP